MKKGASLHKVKICCDRMTFLVSVKLGSVQIRGVGFDLGIELFRKI